MSWTPPLEGGLKDRAMESIATVLDALSTRERDLDGSPSLAGGTAGLAILHGYLAQTEGGQDHAATAMHTFNISLKYIWRNILCCKNIVEFT
jgi:hypothetical protein